MLNQCIQAFLLHQRNREKNREAEGRRTLGGSIHFCFKSSALQSLLQISSSVCQEKCRSRTLLLGYQKAKEEGEQRIQVIDSQCIKVQRKKSDHDSKSYLITYVLSISTAYSTHRFSRKRKTLLSSSFDTINLFHKI